MVRTWCLWPIVSQGTRVFVHLALLLVFLYFFGMPAVVRFAKKEVMIVETTRQTNGIPLPAITISVPHQITDHSCFERNSSIESCLEGIVLNRSDILKSVVLGYEEKNEIIMTKENIREDFIFDFPGIFHTLTLPVKIGPNLFKDALFVGLNTNLTYLVFIHDPEFFFFNDNPLSTPAIIKRFKTKPNSWSYRLELTEVNKLNLPSSPCADDPNYKFLSCMRKSVASKVQRRNISKGTTDPRHQVFI